MKTNFIFLYLFCPLILIAQENSSPYSDRNGEILNRKESTDSSNITRKHIDSFTIYSVEDKIGYRVNNQFKLDISEQPSLKSQVIYTIPYYPKKTHITTKTILIDKDKKTNEISTWLYILTENGKQGWLFLGLDYDPYDNNSWIVLGTIKTKNKFWNLISFNSSVYVEPNANIYDKPDINDSTIIITTRSDITEERVKIIAITEEKDEIDGEIGYWIKIQDTQNRTGWIFSKFTYVNRGGPTFMTPPETIEFQYDFP